MRLDFFFSSACTASASASFRSSIASMMSEDLNGLSTQPLMFGLSVGASSPDDFMRMTFRSKFGISSFVRDMTCIPSSSPTHESSMTTSGSKVFIFSTASSTVLARRTLWLLSARMSLMISWTATLSSTIRIFIRSAPLGHHSGTL